MHSGFVFNSDVQPIHLWLENIPEGMTPRIYMDIGNRDRPDIMQGAIWLEDLLTQFNVAHEWHKFGGEHEETYWQAHMDDYLRWYAQDWQK